MMTKSEFMNYEASKVSEILSRSGMEDISVQLVTVVKMNDQKLTGLCIRRDDETASPNMYLDDAYNAYSAGENPDRIAMDISGRYLALAREAPAADALKQEGVFEGKKIGLRLLEASRNREYLKETPYMSVGNGLVLVCDVRVDEHLEGYYSAVVNNDLLKVMGREKADVFKEAIGEAWNVDRPVLCTMESRLFGEPETNLLDEPGELGTGMYILSNTSGIHGAAALFYPDVQEKISQALGENYYALPSSTEEFIIVPESKGMGPKEFTSMVLDANRTVVDPSQVLSDKVLRYDRDSKVLQDVTAGRELENRAAEMRC